MSTEGSTNPYTLSRFILQQGGDDDRELVILMSSIQLACKYIATSVRKAGIAGLYGLDGATNTSGDEVKKLDMLSNDVFINALKNSKELSVMVSEENEEPIIVEDSLAGKYSIAFDPLDGSSNIDCNVSTGTIFGIYKKENEGRGTIKDILLPGNNLVCSGYCMYGSATMLVVTWGKGVHAFTLDPSLGEFVLTTENVRIPDKPKTIYSCNEGNYVLWDEPTKKFVENCKNASPKPYSARYIGSMVSDVHRTLLYGGIFFYPADKKSKKGKLRLLYEAAPMAFIMEQAGGRASTGTERILDLIPTTIHERSPIFIGCNRDMDAIEKLYKELGGPAAKKQRTA
jgi:fructose-1,6-bisphosphatase I